MDNYSLSDIRAATGGENGGFGFGNGGFVWVILLAILVMPMMMPMMTQMFGGGLFGQNGATAAAQQEILYGQQFQGIHNKLDSIGKGICDSTYAVTGAVTTEGRAMQTQLAECCCKGQLLGKDIMTAIHAEGDATRAMMRENEIQTLRDKVNDLQRDSALCGVVRYPMSMSYCTPCNPFCGGQNPCGGYGCGNGF